MFQAIGILLFGLAISFGSGIRSSCQFLWWSNSPHPVHDLLCCRASSTHSLLGMRLLDCHYFSILDIDLVRDELLRSHGNLSRQHRSAGIHDCRILLVLLCLCNNFHSLSKFESHFIKSREFVSRPYYEYRMESQLGGSEDCVSQDC